MTLRYKPCHEGQTSITLIDYSNKSTHHLASSYISYSATSRLTSGVAFTDLHERTNDASEPEKKLGLEIACDNRQDSVGARGTEFE